MSKCPKDYLTVHPISGEKPDIDSMATGLVSKKNITKTGPHKVTSGLLYLCTFEDGPIEEVNQIFADVIYIGESRAVSRDSMYGRFDFRSTTKNDAVRNPYENVTVQRTFGRKEKHVYRAFFRRCKCL